MSIINRLIRRVEGLLSARATVQNKQFKFDIGESAGTDISELIYKDSAGVEHVFSTKAELVKYVDDSITATIPTDVISSGTYAPTTSNVQNLTAITTGNFAWYRIGDTVNVFGNFEASITTANTLTQIEFTLPIGSNFLDTVLASGHIVSQTGTGEEINLIGLANQQTLVMQFNNSSKAQTGFTDFAVRFSYTIS